LIVERGRGRGRGRGRADIERVRECRDESVNERREWKEGGKKGGNGWRDGDFGNKMSGGGECQSAVVLWININGL
jgi:hypothetical protein